jgi:hypothetical protein
MGRDQEIKRSKIKDQRIKIQAVWPVVGVSAAVSILESPILNLGS